jgi:spore germination protein PC
MEPIWINYLQRLSAYISKQDEKIQRLEQLLNELEEELEEIKNKSTIEKIEYKFDQLKIETLEGTLNIGFSPNGEEQIEEFQVENKHLSVPKKDDQLKERIHHHLFQFIDHEALQQLLALEKDTNRTFDEQYRTIILNDIKQQLSTRIDQHIQQAQNKGFTSDEQIEQSVVTAIKQEITAGLETFVQQRSQPNGDE